MEGRKSETGIRCLVIDVMDVHLREQTIKEAKFCIKGGIFRRKKFAVITQSADKYSHDQDSNGLAIKY